MEWERRFALWFPAVPAGLKPRGFGPDRVAWYLADEPCTWDITNAVVTGGRIIRKIAPQARVMENPYAASTLDMLQAMDPYVDIWCPELTQVKADWLSLFRQRQRALWRYQVIPGDGDPFVTCRLSFWYCWYHGMTGQGFWAYADGSGSLWDPFDAERHDYSVVYDGDPTELIPSRRWEGWREGVEDNEAWTDARRRQFGLRAQTAGQRSGGSEADQRAALRAVGNVRPPATFDRQGVHPEPMVGGSYHPIACPCARAEKLSSRAQPPSRAVRVALSRFSGRSSPLNGAPGRDWGAAWLFQEMPASLGTGASVGHGRNRPASGPDVTQTSDTKAAVAHLASRRRRVRLLRQTESRNSPGGACRGWRAGMWSRRLARSPLARIDRGGQAQMMPAPEPLFDLVLRGGHVIDPANRIDGVCDVAIKGSVIVAVGPELPLSGARKTLNVAGCYVTPGLVDMHVHVFRGYEGWVLPDTYAVPNGVTTVVDAGSVGWKLFEEVKETVIDASKTRVLAFLNIVGAGMGGDVEQDVGDMAPEPLAQMIGKYPGLIVGAKTAHFLGPGWEAVDGTLAAARLSDTIAMIDFAPQATRSYRDLLLTKMRPGDIHTHLYASHIPLLDERGMVNDYVWEARRRGILFDLGHGAASFWFRIAAPAMRQGFGPDTISTDRHKHSELLPNASLPAAMAKMLNLGMPLPEVILRSTLAPARALRRPDLGTLSVGAGADVAVLELARGDFGFLDSGLARLRGNRRLQCALTLRNGEILWDPNGLSRPDWQTAGNYQRLGQYDLAPEP